MRRLKKLEELVLSNNYLQKIPKMARNVERIDLHFNKFSGILSRKSLSSLRNLRELYLQDNKITKLAPNALSRTPIEYLHIGNNLLEVMPQGLPSK
jgi:Leucine-rich repeat (LRR) protein